ncbi:MAG: hypothetical protein M1825_003643 [Sarcosagium campestre]|nr:MAG: hypothetical protein M1825_003643 [Sarcosagium campestre]
MAIEQSTLSSIQDRIPSTVLLVLSTIGLVTLLVPVISYVRLLLSLFVLSGTNVRKYGPKGSWAVVTGASDGIGKEYAIQLAQKGFNLVLVSRTSSKLQSLAQDLTTKYGGPHIQTKLLAMDFAANQDGDYARLASMLEGLDVAVLVNNVGVSHSIPVPFLSTPAAERSAIIAVNCVATLRVTQLVAPGMASRHRGLILTMGSFAGLLPTPLLATYSGSKAFLHAWSTALAAELAPTGVDVQLVVSYLVTSAMSKIRRPSAFIPSPRTYVRAVLARLGRSGGAQELAQASTPYWAHALMHWALVTFVGVGSRVAVGVNKFMHEGIRKKALRKLERDAKKGL